MSKTELIYTTFIKTTPEKLWAAITNPEFSRQYWGGHANKSDWKKGSVWQHADTNDNNNVRITGKVLESNPPKKLVLSWFSPDDEKDASVLTFEIEPLDDLVRLSVVHNEFKPDSVMAGNVSNGWPAVLSSLKSYLETGSGIDLMKVFKGGCGSKQSAA